MNIRTTFRKHFHTLLDTQEQLFILMEEEQSIHEKLKLKFETHLAKTYVENLHKQMILQNTKYSQIKTLKKDIKELDKVHKKGYILGGSIEPLLVQNAIDQKYLTHSNIQNKHRAQRRIKRNSEQLQPKQPQVYTRKNIHTQKKYILNKTILPPANVRKAVSQIWSEKNIIF